MIYNVTIGKQAELPSLIHLIARLVYYLFMVRFTVLYLNEDLSPSLITQTTYPVSTQLITSIISYNSVQIKSINYFVDLLFYKAVDKMVFFFK